jgi:hypothetical protein
VNLTAGRGSGASSASSAEDVRAMIDLALLSWGRSSAVAERRSVNDLDAPSRRSEGGAKVWSLSGTVGLCGLVGESMEALVILVIGGGSCSLLEFDLAASLLALRPGKRYSSIRVPNFASIWIRIGWNSSLNSS